MPAFPFASVLLHQLPDGQGWQIVGIKHNRQRELIATVAQGAGEWLALRWADMAAQNLSGKAGAEVD